MVPLTPAVVGLPGGPELLVILLVVVLMFGVPAALVLVLGYHFLSGQSRAERIAELEQEVEALRERVDATEDEQ